MAEALMPGDQVAFLNEDGGGTVLSIIDENQVMVELDEGFEIPVPKSQLVKVKDFTQEKSASSEKEEQVITQQPQGEPGLYLAFDPSKGGDLLELLVINNTPSIIYFTIFEQVTSSHYEGVSRGELGSPARKMIKRFNQSELNDWRPLIIQGLAFTHSLTSYPEPLHLYFNPKPKTFFKALKYAPFLDREVYLFQVEEENKKAAQQKRSPAKDLSRSDQGNSELEPRPLEWPDIPPHTVDLHIEQLIKNASDLSHSEILEYQMKCFEEALDKGLAWGYDRMVFIHGIGNGVLRERIHLYLRRFQYVKNFKEGPQPGSTEVRL